MTPPITGDTKFFTNMEKSIDSSRLLLIKVRDPGNGWYMDTPPIGGIFRKRMWYPVDMADTNPAIMFQSLWIQVPS